MLSLKSLFRSIVRKVSTQNAKHVENFNHISENWWGDPKIVLLHNMNSSRIPIFKEFIVPVHGDCRNAGTHQPLKGIQILEVGCGAGFLSEPLARMGADVTGIDIVGRTLQIAKDHAALDTSIKENLKYEEVSLEEWAITHADHYDVVLASEVIEHVSEPEYFTNKCVACLRPGGSLIMTTMSKTWIGGFFNIFVCENITGTIPKGSHEYNMFVHPKRLQQMMTASKCSVVGTKGYICNSFTTKSHRVPITWFNYAMHAVKH